MDWPLTARAICLWRITADGNIYEFTPGGAQSTFASGLNNPGALAFDSAGNLFEADSGSRQHLMNSRPDGAQSTFASGLSLLLWDWPSTTRAILFETDFLGGNINEFTPGGAQSTFSSGWTYPQALAFDNAGNLFLFEGSYLNTDIIEFMSGGGAKHLCLRALGSHHGWTGLPRNHLARAGTFDRGRVDGWRRRMAPSPPPAPGPMTQPGEQPARPVFFSRKEAQKPQNGGASSLSRSAVILASRSRSSIERSMFDVGCSMFPS